MKNERHFLIVGAGLAGVTAAIQLLREDQKVTIINNDVNYSSKIAAGLINPIVFRRMAKGWRVDEFIPYSKDFYRGIEEKTNSSFFHKVLIRRLHSSNQEREEWIKKQDLEEFKSYLYRINEEDANYDKSINEFGSARLKETFYVDVHAFFPAVTRLIEKKGQILHKTFDYSLLNGTIYNGIEYDDILFCEGYLGKDNPWFGNLPLTQTKGETLVIKSESLPGGVSLNRKCFMLPKGNQLFKIGSTYSWDDPTTHITEEAKKELLENLAYITTEEVEVVDQEAGIRPTTVDRRPLLGTHPDFPHYHIFNGLGAKGYLLAPLISSELVQFLLYQTPLSKEVDIRRCKKEPSL